MLYRHLDGQHRVATSKYPLNERMALNIVRDLVCTSQGMGAKGGLQWLPCRRMRETLL